jgi:drug/metabolite transporter (DMT)-like permease
VRPEERRGLLYVALAVSLFSTSPVFIVWADPMPALTKTWLRMLIAAAAVGGAAWLISRRPSDIPYPEPPARRAVVLKFLGYGLIAALHFYFYIASLDFTTAAHSLAIVYTAPIFVTLFSAWFLGEPVRRRQWAGVGIGVIGIAIVAGLEPELGLRMALGDALALLSAITFGLYSVAGRYERARYPLLVYASRVYVYASRVYGAAALWLLPLALFALPSAPPGSWGWRQLGSVLALGLGPLALGHTLYNASLRRVHATYVNIIASQEVTGGILLSWLLLSQTPSANSLVGAVVTLIGTGLVLK